MIISDRFSRVVAYFERTMPDPKSELSFATTFQLLVAVMLSAQCTDKRVNLVTGPLFAAMPDAEAMGRASVADILALISSVSYPNAKAAHLQAMARRLVEVYGGEVPSEMDALLTLPGVGRKTANVVLAVAFGRAAMAVDTHIFRVSHRLGLARPSDNTPEKVECRLTRYLPEAVIPRAHHWLLLHGRYVCTARRPKCEECGLREICGSELRVKR